MTTNMTLIAERIEYCKRSIAERRKLAQDFRGQAIGASVEQAAQCLELARICEAGAGAMETTLNILFDLNLHPPREQI